jgi:hypothetical protein
MCFCYWRQDYEDNVRIIIFILLISAVFPIHADESIDRTRNYSGNFDNTLMSNQHSIEVIVDGNGNGRNFHMTTYIKNNEDENVVNKFSYIPGAGFEISNQNEELVYISPKNVWWIMRELLIAADQTEDIYNQSWNVIDNNWKKLPGGNYSV